MMIFLLYFLDESSEMYYGNGNIKKNDMYFDNDYGNGGINDEECMIMINNGVLHIFFIYIMCYICLF